jgi:hypothetical protein
MPTADLVADREFVAELQVDGSLEHVDADTRFINLQLGAADRCEFGVGADLSEESEERWLVNAKLLLWKNESDTLRLAAGFRNLGDEASPEGYGVATATRGCVRGHLGFTASEERDVDGIAGFDIEWSPGWWGYGEWTSGKENAGSVGVNIPCPCSLDLMVGLILPNAAKNEVGYTVHLVYGAAVPGLNSIK